ncbi:ABC transporter permease [Paenibacillus hodogayensis]|uniref:ABC transporter permease n=1 Tax=Paenibacillus hodogayensis TaxID=279208 RepID=A0ABV5W0B7_9BACL
MKRRLLFRPEWLVYGAVLFLAIIVVCAAVPQWIAPYSPTEMNPANVLKPPSSAHLFGTDFMGRDVLSVVVYGSRDSLIIGVASVTFAVIIGGAIGVLAGYAGGLLDTIMMRLVEILMTIPGILMALAIAAALKPSLFNVVLAIAISAVPGYARVLRGQVLSIRSRPYITAAHSIGTSETAIFFRHVLPNSWSPLLVMATIGLGTSILVGSGLSFLGLGIIKEVPDWGAFLSQGRSYLMVAWWMSTFPGLTITLLVLSVNLLGDRLRDYLDPRSRRT